MPAGPCGGCGQITNSATSDWWFTRAAGKKKPTKCYAKFDKKTKRWSRGCGFDKLAADSFEREFAESQRSHPMTQDLERAVARLDWHTNCDDDCDYACHEEAMVVLKAYHEKDRALSSSQSKVEELEREAAALKENKYGPSPLALSLKDGLLRKLVEAESRVKALGDGLAANLKESEDLRKLLRESQAREAQAMAREAVLVKALEMIRDSMPKKDGWTCNLHDYRCASELRKCIVFDHIVAREALRDIRVPVGESK